MIKLGNRIFSPPWWATALFLLVGAAMLLLGRWQLQRAAEKISLATAAEQALSGDPVDLLELLPAAGAATRSVISSQQGGSPGLVDNEKSAASADYRRVTAAGNLLADRQFLWDNRIHKGKAGFEVIIPLQLAGTANDIVLLNRGWIPAGVSRDKLPDISLNSAHQLVVSARVEGLLTQPSRGFAQGPAVAANRVETDIEAQWPKLLQYFDYSAISDSLGAPVVTGLIQHIAEDAISASGFRADELLKTDNWQPVANGPEKHYGYAFQWFGMFIALVAIYWITNSRKINGDVVDELNKN